MVDPITLYESTETLFESNGLGNLSDFSKCTVVEERNGAYELSGTYPVTGKNYDKIKLRRIILAKPNPNARTQPFRIYEISKPINGLVTVKAEHVRYDLAGHPISNIIATRASTALETMINLSPTNPPFTTWSNRTQIGTFVITKPTNILSMLGGTEGSVLDIFGGEYEFDRFDIKLWKDRGKNRGVTIEYGKNMTDLTQEENCANVYTGVYPYWVGTDEENNEVMAELPYKIIHVDGAYNYDRILTLDLSSEFQDMPSQSDIESVTKQYIYDHDIGVPKVNLKVSFIQLTQSDEYQYFNLLEQVNLCDYLNVSFPELGVNATAKVVKTTYDVIAGKYESIELGESKQTSFAESIAVTERKVSEQVTLTAVEQVANHTAKLINGCFGGNVMLNYLEGSDKPYEILIMDTDNIKTARKIWRWNQGGLAYSNSGYEGPWIVGMNSMGEINGQLIAAETINGNAIESGTIDYTNLNGAEEIVTTADISHMANYIEEGQLWLQFDMNSNTGLWIGRIDSQFLVNITNEQMSFVQNDKYEEAIGLSSSRPNVIVPFWNSTADGDGKSNFLVKVNSITGEYEFTWATINGETGWSLNGSILNITEYGIEYNGHGNEVAGDTITVTLSNSYRSGRVVAYISNNKLLIKDAHIKETLSFGKDTKPATIEVKVGSVTASFSGGSDAIFRNVIGDNPGVYEFIYIYKNYTWEDLQDETWEDLGNATWVDLGIGRWELNGNEVDPLNYGITITGTPQNGDIVSARYDAIPIDNFSFIPNEDGSLQFKWTGPAA